MYGREWSCIKSAKGSKSQFIYATKSLTILLNKICALFLLHWTVIPSMLYILELTHGHRIICHSYRKRNRAQQIIQLDTADTITKKNTMASTSSTDNLVKAADL